jgi:predicted DNA-binding protein with PD1-like motif
MVFKKIHVFRVKPKQELSSEIAGYCRLNEISSGVVIGIVGSVENIKLNFLKELPGRFETKEYAAPLEITVAQGSIALKDSELIVHIHLQVSDPTTSVGGHLVQARIFSTAEVVIGELDYQLQRYADDITGLNELMSQDSDL